MPPESKGLLSKGNYEERSLQKTHTIVVDLDRLYIHVAPGRIVLALVRAISARSLIEVTSREKGLEVTHSFFFVTRIMSENRNMYTFRVFCFP